MKIAIDCRMYGNEQFTGIGTYIQKLTAELFRIDQKNQYLLFMNDPEYSRFTPPNNRVKKILVNIPHYSYAEQIKFPWELKKHDFDLIHFPHFNSPVLWTGKSVCTIHDLTPFYYPGHKAKSGWRRWAHKKVFKSTTKKAQKIIAVSQNTKKEINKMFDIDSKKIKITYEGVDERFKIIENNGIISKVKENYGNQGPYIYFVGVWRQHKNLEGLIKAFNLLKKNTNLSHKLVLGGRKDLHYTKARKEIESSAFKNQIITPGYIKDHDLPILYSGADCFALPSFIEGFGLIAIEAQNCGCPVVSTKTSSMPEVLADSALYFDPRKPQEIA